MFGRSDSLRNVVLEPGAGQDRAGLFIVYCKVPHLRSKQVTSVEGENQGIKKTNCQG